MNLMTKLWISRMSAIVEYLKQSPDTITHDDLLALRVASQRLQDEVDTALWREELEIM